MLRNNEAGGKAEELAYFELQAFGDICGGNPIAAFTLFDTAHALVVEDFTSFPVLHAERPRLTLQFSR